VLAYRPRKYRPSARRHNKDPKAQAIYDSTLIIVSWKNGQSPINPGKLNKPGHFADLVAALPDATTNPGGIVIANANSCSTGSCGFVQDDDIALIGLQDQNQIHAVTDYLNTNSKGLFIQYILAGDSLKLKFNDPLHDTVPLTSSFSLSTEPFAPVQERKTRNRAVSVSMTLTSALLFQTPV
jgi:hypothetical protein